MSGYSSTTRRFDRAATAGDVRFVDRVDALDHIPGHGLMMHMQRFFAVKAWPEKAVG